MRTQSGEVIDLKKNAGGHRLPACKMKIRIRRVAFHRHALLNVVTSAYRYFH